MSIALGVQAMNLAKVGNIAGMGKNWAQFTVSLYSEKKNKVQVKHHFKDAVSCDKFLDSLDPRDKNGNSTLRGKAAQHKPSYTVSDNGMKAIILKVRM